MNMSKRLFAARALFAGLMTFALSQSAVAAFTPAQVPLSLGGQVEPNVMFLLDDSGSMRWGFMPDELRPSYLDVNQRPASSSGCRDRGNYAGTYTHFCSETGHRYLVSSKLNTIYYNPDVSYLPPLKADGTRSSNAIFSSAYLDGYAQSGTAINLSDNYRAIMDDFYRPSRDGYKGFVVGPASGSSRAFYYSFISGCGSTTADTCYQRVSLPSSAAVEQNFANWFSYYRTRLMAAKAGVSDAFAKQPGDIRVGYGSINQGSVSVDTVDTTTVKRGVRRFEDTGRTDFYSWLFATQANGGTPLRRALGDAGEYFSRQDQYGPWSSTPGLAGGESFSCRQSYTILTTDGYWNGDSASASDARKNVDNLNGLTISGPDGQSYRYAPKSPFSDSYPDTLADVAMYYWNRDLHPTLDNRVPTDPADPAFWQHMVTFGVGLGVSGSIASKTGFDAVKTGAVINWLDPRPDDNSAAKIDDLLHAGINSRGDFFNARDPQQFATALSDTLSSVANRTGSSTAAVPTARRLDSDTLVYEALYSSADWSGKLLAKKPTQTSTGIDFKQIWEASSQLSYPSRRLFSHDGSAGVALSWGSLAVPMKAHFDNSEALFDYVMGSRVNEAPAGLKYRKRSTLLGDIVNSTLVIANKQDWGFNGRVPLPASGQTYAQFVAAKASKVPTLFVGANDGFLHAFNANAGNELFAYMPNGALPAIKELASSNYKHRYYVDGKLHVRDAVLDGGWKTVLLGSLGAGGKSVFALDVTDTSGAGFGAAKVLWEIKDDADLGYNFGEPLIGRMKDGSWAAIFGNGHGSTNDDSVLFIVNLASGAVNKVRAGSATGGLASPSFVYAADASGNIYVKDVYAGDLGGNLWKFELKSTGDGVDDFQVSLKSGGQPQPLYIAADAAGKRQPITVKPEIAYHPGGVVKGVIVYFGTGRMYTAGDVSDTSGQTFYGIWDKPNSAGASIAFSGRTELEGRSILFEGPAFGREVRALDAPASPDGIDWASKRGWYLDLQSPVLGAQGERVIFAPRILLDRLVFETAIPSADPCQAGGSGWTMVVNLATGGRLSYVLFDMNKDGKFDAADSIIDADGNPLPASGIGSSTGIPTGSFDLLDGKKYWLCRGTGIDDCVPAANTLNIIEGRQSWNQIR
ncbi:PilC/PilY family type IV pilus protein [Pseudomonas sp.]|uniref:pilus assembly protein n=1 Tax=Pseudomonas sp. TaxID=306 RepID=UPI002627470B|nr:PilC/PilY family type IV pilus protein [Pseudomonas sp.]